jgi:hypothetical protein
MARRARIKDLQPREPVTLDGNARLRLPRIARDLDQPRGWLHELAQLYRLARRNQMSVDDASRLAFLCAQAGKLAASVAELKYMASIEQQLKALESGQAVAGAPPAPELSYDLSNLSPEQRAELEAMPKG